ncbi:MAG: hypothetical protein LBH44_02720, partial [Treponema sp.]|nr:hypothetical protein [Treponema sp.]
MKGLAQRQPFPGIGQPGICFLKTRTATRYEPAGDFRLKTDSKKPAFGSHRVIDSPHCDVNR